MVLSRLPKNKRHSRRKGSGLSRPKLGRYGKTRVSKLEVTCPSRSSTTIVGSGTRQDMGTFFQRVVPRAAPDFPENVTGSSISVDRERLFSMGIG